jgi:hypothetical protein
MMAGDVNEWRKLVQSEVEQAAHGTDTNFKINMNSIRGNLCNSCQRFFIRVHPWLK